MAWHRISGDSPTPKIVGRDKQPKYSRTGTEITGNFDAPRWIRTTDLPPSAEDARSTPELAAQINLAFKANRCKPRYMKTIAALFALVSAAFALTPLALTRFEPMANAAIQGAPFIPEVDNRFNCLESGTCTGPGSGAGFASGAVSGTALAALSVPWSALLTGQATGAVGAFPETIYKATFSMIHTAATLNTGIVLPAKSIIKQAFFRVNVVPTPGGTTLAVQCVGANDVFTATDETGASIGNTIAGTETGTAATMLDVVAGCTVQYLIGTHTGTAGNITLFLDVVPAN